MRSLILLESEDEAGGAAFGFAGEGTAMGLLDFRASGIGAACLQSCGALVACLSDIRVGAAG